ncbi:MAG: 50S ribosomal protein L11 methyltransferase [Muribaculaceae bacterium]|nr:50S ribosomal protein L11 methyltransferase [Muribaculaceae bacterium]
MYDYISLRIDATPCDENVTDLLAAFLAETDYETFVPDNCGLTAYVRKDKFSEEGVKDILRDFPMDVKLNYSFEEIEGEDWNKEWEQNYYQPIQIDNKLVVRSSFHTDYPRGDIEIIIDPKMAFGTGHHSTTAGVTSLLLEEDLKGKRVIDMGTGTGILSIIAKKLGAGETTGIDIDEFAIENAIENAENNNVAIKFYVGDDRILKELEPADLFFANINLNVILDNLDKYVAKIKPGGKIFLSGFLMDDKEKILKRADELGLTLEREKEDKNWVSMKLRLKSPEESIER